MADGANATEALHRDRNFPIGPPLDENLETTELDNMQAHLMHLIMIVEQNGHLAVALDSRNRIDGDTSEILAARGGFEIRHGLPQSKCRKS
jgi:hypothetical protein